MADTPNWHDAHALVLIDHALEDGGFTRERVSQITDALRAAAEAPRVVPEQADAASGSWLAAA
jgi:hypothetical protein